MNITVVYNSKSGNALSKNELNALFAKAGITVDHYVDITKDFERELQQYAQKNAVVAAIGGDGTLSSVANKLVETEAIFAPLPGGTLNHFTKDLGIDQHIENAIAAIASTKPRLIDSGSINGAVFLNNSSLGFYPAIVTARENLENKIGKWPAAFFATLKATLRYHSYRVEIDGRIFRTPFIFIGNNDYHLIDDPVAGRTSLSNGELSVYIATSPSRFVMLKQLCLILLGRFDAATHLQAFTTKEITIRTHKKRMHVSRDGEVDTLHSPLHYSIRPKSLRVIAPAASNQA